MRLEFVHQVDGTIITKLVTKSLCFFPVFKLKSGMANAVPAVAVPTPLQNSVDNSEIAHKTCSILVYAEFPHQQV